MITALFAIDKNGGMGFNGIMPWPLNKDDMKFFKSVTTGQTVVMGRKTWDSPDMPSPLPNRHNVLFTTTFLERDDITQVKGDVCEVLKLLHQSLDHEMFVIGGSNLIQQAKPVLDRVYLTRILGEYQCDTSIDIDQFLTGFTLTETHNLGTCQVEEYRK